MARVLMTWEFGAGLGHLNRLLPVAARLRAQGHDITIAVPAPAAVRAIVDNALARTVPLDRPPLVSLTASPFWPGPTDPAARKVPTHTLADVLKLFGYHDLERLRAMAARWDSLVGDTRPDLIVSDFCPTLTLAVAGRVPHVGLGNGYTIPPAGRTLPPIRPWEREPPGFSRVHEALMLRTINGVRTERGDRPVGFFADLFSGDRHFVCTIPEFDPYARFRDGPTLIPFNVTRMPPGTPPRQRPDDHVFVYLPNNHPLLKATVAALSLSPITGDLYVKDPPAGLMAPSNFRVHGKPLHLPDILGQTSLIIHHAGLATAYAAALAGVPQLVLPYNLEHVVTARGLARMAGALVREATRPAAPEELAGLIKQGRTDEKILAAASNAAQELARRPWQDGVSAVIEGCSPWIDPRP